MSKKERVFIGIQLLVFTVFIALNLGMVFAYGVCCGDDSYHAHVAKNLADGLGYASTLPLSEQHYAVTPFDPYLGTGPTIILPAALMIKVFSNAYWVPGMSEVLIWSTLLFCIGLLLNKIVRDKGSLAIAALVIFYYFYTLMAYHFEQWYALLGEIPAALLIILAVLCYFVARSKTNLFISGILFSLAFETKLITLLPFAIFLAFIAALEFLTLRKRLKEGFQSTVYTFFFIALGFFIPILIFELWKLYVLGVHGYVVWWKQYLAYVLNYGTNIDQSFINRVVERINTANQRFGIYLPFLFILFAIIGFAIRKEEKLLSLFVIFIGIITIYTAYWLVFSSGWARYYIIALMMAIFILPFPLLDHHISIRQKALFGLLLIGLSIYNIKEINITYPFENIKLYQQSANTKAQLKISQMLSTEVDERPFYTFNWATAVDIEYLLDTHLNFSTIFDPSIDFTKSRIVVVNTRLLFVDDPNLTKLLSECTTHRYAVYIYAICPGVNPQ